MAQRPVFPPVQTRSGRTVKPTSKMAQYMAELLHQDDELSDSQWETMNSESGSETSRKQVLSDIKQQKLELTNRMLRLEVEKLENEVKLKELQVREKQERLKETSVLPQVPKGRVPSAPLFTSTPAAPVPQRSPPVMYYPSADPVVYRDNNSPVYYPQVYTNYDNTRPKGLNPEAPPYDPYYHDHSFHDNYDKQQSRSDDALERLADILSRKQERLPDMEPEVFGGNLINFPIWLKSFESLIERKTTSCSEKLYFLNKYTTGDAKRCIQGFFALDDEEAYALAKSTLMERYGDKYRISEAFKQQLNAWPQIKPGDGEGLRKLADFLQHCMAAMKSISHLRCLDSAEENRKILAKLPRYLTDRWNRIIDRWLYGAIRGSDPYEMRQEGCFPPFAEFCKFLTEEARIACGPGNIPFSEKKPHIKDQARGGSRRDNKVSTFASQASVPSTSTPRAGDTSTQSSTSQPKAASGEASSQRPDEKRGERRPPFCTFCKGSHYIDKCDQFLKLPPSERKTFAKSHGLCYGCLRRGHLYKECKRRNPSLLKPETVDSVQAETADSSRDTSGVTTFKTELKRENECGNGLHHSMIVPVVVHHQDNPDKTVKTYALLDSQSSASFISEGLLQDLSVPDKGNLKQVDLELTTMLSKGNIKSNKVQGLVMKGLYEVTHLSLPCAYSRSVIPANRELIPRPETVRRWPHLINVAEKLSPVDDNIEVGLLIGFDCSAALLPREVAANGDNEPYGIRTLLGWSVTGPVGDQPGDTKPQSNSFVFRTQVKEVTMAQVRNVFDADFSDGPDAPLSMQDKKFLTKVTDGIHRRGDGHLEMPLPFKEKDVSLPNNREMALKRLNGLKWKLMRNSQYKTDYTAFMTQLIEKGHAEKVPMETSNDAKTGNTWYIPHHGVYHSKKPDKIRIVFDCSAEYDGQSLNQHLLSGPDLINNLTGVLCRFRKERVAVTCDIEGMFHQVGVDEPDRDFLRFLWWENGDLTRDPTEYRMTVHLFGATSSPGCANFALKSTAEIGEDEFGLEASKFLKEDFYVDDGLKSVETPEEALCLIDSARKLCMSTGFNLHKFASNSKVVLGALPQEILAKDLQNLDMSCEHLPVERTLGVHWNIQSDTFQFSVLLQDKPFTRRGILSTISSVYDPLGLVSPFLLNGKKLLQELCQDKRDWDEEVPDHIRYRWQRWRTELAQLSSLEIPRCYKDTELAELKRVELHHFSDACQDGYGQCSYIRQVDVKDNVSCTLAFSKAKVAPVKMVTIPRLELTAALLSVKVSTFLTKELGYSEIKNFYWTDSNVVLGYLANESKRFHIFVANRVQQIRNHTDVDQWNYIATNENPADSASRGMSADDLTQSDLWWKGPKFLNSMEPLPITDVNPSLEENDPEVKRVVTHSTSVMQELHRFPSMLTRLEYFSDWHRAKRAFAVCIRFKNLLKARAVKRQSVSSMTPRALKAKIKADYRRVDAHEMQLAEKAILQLVQVQAFPEETKCLGTSKKDQHRVERHKRSIKRKSKLHKLDPYLGQDGLIHVGGRIHRANVASELAHPVVLPRSNHITRLVISHFHEKTCHSGRSTTLNEIRASGYWIVRGRAAVASVLRKCVSCKKWYGAPANQKMADLPVDRLVDAPPFTYSGVDFFGPFYVKEGRSEKKRWGCLFTCLSSRAIHIEVAHSLSTDSFINCYRRFVGRRGPVRELRCDRGTNFVGAKSEMDAALQEMNQDKISQHLLKDGCDWIEFRFNVPHASHMGGVWERMIRSVRRVLTALLDQSGTQLDDELLHTFIVEAESIVNSRPITYVDMTSPDSAEPLTPSQILTLRSKVVLPPPGKFVKEDIYCRKRWRRVQYLSNEFWTRWRKEFLPTLQERCKWARKGDNIQEDDVVLMTDENLPRCEWPLARVIQVTTDEDNLVRKVKVKTSTSTFERPIHKLVLLYRPGIPVEEP